MITDRWVFEDAYPPQRVLHRDTEIAQLSRALEPAVYGDRGEDVLIYGPSGVGKTTTTRHVLCDLHHDHGLEWALIKSSSGTRCGILHEAIVKHAKDAAIHRNSPHEELVDALQAIVDRPYVLVLDEADTIADLGVLEDLFSVPKLSVIAICHDQTEWLARLDEDLGHYFALKSQIGLDRYTTDELVDILEPRVERGLAPGVVREGQLEWIADEVAGVARYGIKTLLGAAEIAQERGHDYFHENDVRDGFERARQMIRTANLRSLPFGPLVVYELLRLEGGLVKSGRLHDLYERFAPTLYAGRDQDPVGRRSVLNYLEKLVEYDLIRQHGENRWAKYEVIDEDLEAPVEMDLEAANI